MDLRRKAMDCFHQYDPEMLGYIAVKDFEALFNLLVNNKLINPNIFCESIKIKLGLVEENCDKLLMDAFITWFMMVIYIYYYYYYEALLLLLKLNLKIYIF